LTSGNNQGTNGEISPSNGAPAVNLPDGVLSYAFAGADAGFSSANVNDLDGNADWNGGTLTVQITGNANINDQLGIYTNNTSPKISISGTTLSVDGTAIATISQNYGTPAASTVAYQTLGSTALVFTFNASATNRSVSRLAENLNFKSSTAGTGNRTITVTAIDKFAHSGADQRQIGTSPSAPTVTTSAATANSDGTASGGGNVTSEGGASVTERGVCWSTSTGPTISNSRTIDGTGSGTFVSSLTNLTSGVTYYVRAYATNIAGTVYGNEVSFTALKAPTVTTEAVSSIATTTAAGNGTITDLGVPNPTAYGVCWHTSTGPTTANSVVDNGAATVTGAFTSSITGLTPLRLLCSCFCDEHFGTFR
jgi:hypothetical protein